MEHGIGSVQWTITLVVCKRDHDFGIICWLMAFVVCKMGCGTGSM